MFGFKKNAGPSGTKATLRITGMHCTSCSMSIDGELEDLPGVFTSKTNYAKARTEVEYDPAAVTLGAMTDAIRKLGYDAAPEEG